MQHPATSVALETDLTCTYAIIFLVSEGMPPVLLFGVQLERCPEVGYLTGKWDFPADVVVTIFVIIKDTCGVRVADRVVVCELLLVGEVPPLVLSGLGGKDTLRASCTPHSFFNSVESLFDEFGVCEVHSQTVLTGVLFHSFMEVASTFDGDVNSHLFSVRFLVS
jgi:hypothetical protein